MKIGDKVKYVKSLSEVHPVYVNIAGGIEIGWISEIIKIYNNPKEVANDHLVLDSPADLSLYPWIKLKKDRTDEDNSDFAVSPLVCLELVSNDKTQEKIPCNCPILQVVNFGCKNKNHY